MRLVALSIFGATIAACGTTASVSPTVSSSPASERSSTTPVASASAGPSTVVSPTATVQLSSDISGTLVFARGGDLYTIEAAGEKQLTATELVESAPEWSPDGRSIVLTGETEGRTDLYVIAADGTGARRLTNTPDVEGAAGWSPDGKRIAFATFADPGGGRVSVIDADGSRPAEIYADANAFIGFDEWLPDGRILLGIDRAGGGELDLYALEPKTKRLVALVQNPGDDSGGRLSPDGTKLAFWSDNGPGGEGPGIYVARANGKSPHLVFADTLGLDTASLAWSPDNTEIAWAGKFEGGSASAIFAGANTGANLRQLTGQLSAPSRIDWR
jgi:Tol biopolymer transport system component